MDYAIYDDRTQTVLRMTLTDLGPQRPDGISDALWAQICRVAELARDTPEIAAIFREFDSLIQRQISRNFSDTIGSITRQRL